MIATSLEDVREVLAKNLSLDGVDINALDKDSPLFDGLGLDSLDAVEILIILRKNYDVVIENMEQGKKAFQTLETLRKHIEENRKK
ncbi:acyl carrier protein [Campylobacterota bacterium]|nr:acyl carrier protein [Campylobacterota bacterium]